MEREDQPGSNTHSRFCGFQNATRPSQWARGSKEIVTGQNDFKWIKVERLHRNDSSFLDLIVEQVSKHLEAICRFCTTKNILSHKPLTVSGL
jgi:hypothetical protein